MLTKKEMETMELTHRHGGNDLAMVKYLDKEYVLVASASYPGHPNDRIRLASVAHMAVSERRSDPKDDRSPMEKIPLPEDVMPKITEIRDGLKTGKLTVVNQRLVET